WTIVALSMIAAVAGTVVIQTRKYLLVSPEELTIRDKGGRQWVELRRLGREMARRTKTWPQRRLYIWGWQSPLWIYSGMHSVTPHVFADPLLTAYAGREHPLITPRIERILRDLDAKRPELILVGERPFPGLVEFLHAHYLPSRIALAAADGRGLWVERSHFASFESDQSR